MGMKRCPADGVGRGEFEEAGANQTPREVVISRPNPSGIGQRSRVDAGAVRPPFDAAYHRHTGVIDAGRCVCLVKRPQPQ
jgi:hypothetical protein